MEVLNKIQTDFNIPHDLYLSCKKNLELVTGVSNDFLMINDFLDELPPKLKI